ncbi:MAG: prolyl oligopeptidase family serine peptidase, partial [Bacteroidota bacterium]
NWYGITEMEKAIKFWNDSAYTQMILDKWEGDPKQYLEFTSPISHVHDSSRVPIISIHGDQDENVEFAQALSLHEALKAKGIKNKLLKIAGKKHGGFTSEEYRYIFAEIEQFFEWQAQQD